MFRGVWLLWVVMCFGSVASVVACQGDIGASGSTGPSEDTSMATDSETDVPSNQPLVIEDLQLDKQSVSEHGSVTVTATVADPDGPADITDGVLTDSGGAITYGTFHLAEDDTFTLRLSWSQFHDAAALDFVGQSQRSLKAVFTDSVGHQDEASVELSFVCEGFPSLSGACGGKCMDLSTESDCGACGNTCDDTCNVAHRCGSCGNGTFEYALGEQCDDGNPVDGDGCDNNCQYSSPIQSVALGSSHTCVLTMAGDVKCWGSNVYGQLGYGSTAPIGDDETPAAVPVVDLGEGLRATQIAAGKRHTCVLLEGGDIKCWGGGGLGLGSDEYIGDDETPADVPPVDVGGSAIQVATGGNHTCALLANDGEVKCWGYNYYGQLGYGDTNDVGGEGEPVPAEKAYVGVGGAVTEISASDRGTCVLVAGGQVRCWGDGQYGLLGLGNTKDSCGNPYKCTEAGHCCIGDDEAPHMVSPIDFGDEGLVMQLSVGERHACVLFDSGQIKCWGANHNASGVLGNGSPSSIGDDETPASSALVSLGGPGVFVSSGDEHNCALLEGRHVLCWGDAGFGQLGYGNTEDTYTSPASDAGPVPLGAVATAIAAGGDHTCALLENGLLKCWGKASSGQLGHGNFSNLGDEPDETPDLLPPVEVF